MPTIILPDNSQHEYPAGSTAMDVANKISPRLAQQVVAAVVNGNVVDAFRPLDEIAENHGEIKLKLLTEKDPEALGVLRHSAAHVMARAIMRVFPGVGLAFGPTTGHGFYYDFDIRDARIREEDFH